MILFLIGFMGSGKSHYAKAISSYLNVPCLDLDTEIESAERKKINQIFAENGEDYFRTIESAILRKTLDMVKLSHMMEELNNRNIFAVIACGGGTPCFNGNMEWMNQHGMTIWIAPPVKVLAERLEKEKNHRPLIKDFSNSEMLEFVQQKLKERISFYSQAKIVIQDPNMAAADIIKQIKNA
jgi:shikimate kinase